MNPQDKITKRPKVELLMETQGRTSTNRARAVFRPILSVVILAAAVVGISQAGPAPATASARAPWHKVARHPGMTWKVLGQRADAVVSVGADDLTNAYQGDTPARTKLPILCLFVDGSAVPKGVVPNFYHGWARGWVALTSAVRGMRLTSRSAANAICAKSFGPGWRMAEHHDGWYGNPPVCSHWHFLARGFVPQTTRFWVAINDQKANPWN